MIERFRGPSGIDRLHDALMMQTMVAGGAALAQAILASTELRQIPAGGEIIHEDASSDSVFFIVAGSFDISVKGRVLARRSAGTHVGEMAALDPAQPRSATVTAAELSVVAKVSQPDFSEILALHPAAWRPIALTLSVRLKQRNTHIGEMRDRVRIFVISSKETLEIAEALSSALRYESFAVNLWTHGVYRASNYPLDDLDAALDTSDFAVAIAGADDVTESRNVRWPVPRDNVIFELGYFMGRLGRERTVLLEPVGEHVKLPSDFAGLKTVGYKWSSGSDRDSDFAPSVYEVRAVVRRLGPITGL